MYLIGVVSGSGTDSELNSTGNYEWWISTLPLSMSWWSSLPMIAKTIEMVLGGDVLYLKWAAGGWLFQSLGGSFGSSPLSVLNWFIFIIIIGGRRLCPRMMQAPALCPILSQHSKKIFCIIPIDEIFGWRDSISFLMEDEGPKLWDLWTEVINFVGAPIIYR